MEAGGDFSVQTLVKATGVGLMAVSVDGSLIAWGENELNLYELASRSRKRLLDSPPDALCWSPDGAFLAAAIRLDTGSHLYIFERNGIQVYDQQITGRIGRLQWPGAGALTASVLEHEIYSFGTHIVGQLVQWDEGWQYTKIQLYETTINPNLSTQLAGRLHETLDFDISPLGDEVLYARLYAPPAFAPARHLILRNLKTGAETKITPLPILNGVGRLTHDGEFALISKGEGEIIQQKLWGAEVLQAWSGNRLDYDASSGLLLADHQLFLDKAPLIELPRGSQAQLSSGGRFLLVKWQKQLYLLTGYALNRNQSLNGDIKDKLLKLRRLRSRGLIEQNEYLQSRKRLLQ